jgi:hypothetical protein
MNRRDLRASYKRWVLILLGIAFLFLVLLCRTVFFLV